MLQRVRDFFNTWLLIELGKGLWVTLGNMFARKVTVLHEGSILCEGPVEQVQKDDRVMEVYLGRSREADA